MAKLKQGIIDYNSHIYILTLNYLLISI